MVIGNRAAAFAPVRDLGLVALWDDGDDLLAEQRAPYPHARDVLAIRAAEARAGALVRELRPHRRAAGLAPARLASRAGQERSVVRHDAPRVKVAVDSDYALAHDPAAAPPGCRTKSSTSCELPCRKAQCSSRCPAGGIWSPWSARVAGSPSAADSAPAPPGRIAMHLRAGGTGRGCDWCGRLQLDWECPICGSRRMRAPIVGAEPHGRGTRQGVPADAGTAGGRRNGRATVPDVVGDRRCYAGHRASGGRRIRGRRAAGYPDVAATSRSAGGGGGTTTLAQRGGAGPRRRRRRVGDRCGGELRAGLQALVRVDPAGFAARELAERAAAVSASGEADDRGRAGGGAGGVRLAASAIAAHRTARTGRARSAGTIH